MGCCGQKRVALRTAGRPAKRATVTAPPRPQSAGDTRVAYSGTSTVRVFGEWTGSSYVFSRALAAQQMDAGDAAALARSSGLFRIER